LEVVKRFLFLNITALLCSWRAVILVQAVIPYGYLTDIVVDGRRAEALFNVGLAMSYVFGKLVEDQPYV